MKNNMIVKYEWMQRITKNFIALFIYQKIKESENKCFTYPYQETRNRTAH